MKKKLIILSSILCFAFLASCKGGNNSSLNSNSNSASIGRTDPIVDSSSSESPSSSGYGDSATTSDSPITSEDTSSSEDTSIVYSNSKYEISNGEGGMASW